VAVLHYIDQFKGLPKQVYVLCGTKAILGISSMSFTISPLLLRSVLGLDQFHIGIIVAGLALTGVVFSVLGGRLSDLYGRKKITTAMYLCLCVSLFASSLVCRTRAVIPLLFVNNAFSSSAKPGEAAMVADALEGTGRSEGFSLMYLAHNLGIAFGPSIGGMLFYRHMTWVYRVQIVFILIALSVFVTCTKELYDPAAARARALAEHSKKGRDVSEESLARVIFDRPVLLVFFISMVFITMCYQMVSFMLNMQLTDAFGLEIASKYAGFVWTANAATIVICTPFIVAHIKNLHQYQKMIIGLFFYAAGFGAYIYLKSPVLSLVYAIIWSIGEIIIATDAGGFIAKYSPASHVARCQSLYETSRYAGRSFAPALYGYLLGYISYEQAWGLNACMCFLLAAVITVAFLKHVRRAH